MKKYKYISIFILVLLIFLLLTNRPKKPIEERAIPVGVGYDIQYIGENKVKYIVSICQYIFQENKIEKIFRTGTGYTISKTRENRQTKSNKNFLLGSEKIYILSEKCSRYGLHNLINILFNNPEINDLCDTLVFQGNPDNLLKFNASGYESSSEFLEGLIKNSHDYNFFSKDYSLMDLYARIESEGRNCSIPYVEIKNGGIEITGVALFNKDKMVSKIDVSDAKIMYMLKEETSTGIISLVKSSDEFIDFSAKVKQKRSCEKIGNKYFFIINLSINGDIVNNELYNNLSTDLNAEKQFKKDMQSYILKQCNEFIYKMKSEIKLDCLDLGRLAAAKYGRHTGVDWNKIVCNSNIKVNVTVKIDKLERANY